MFNFFRPHVISKNKFHAISWDLMLISTWNFYQLVSLKKGLIILQNIRIWAKMNKLMEVVNRIDIQEQNCIIKNMSRFCRCVFKNYWERKSRTYRSACIIWQILKFKTREDRASGIQIPYKIEDDTNIENITSENLMLIQKEILKNI